MEIPVTATKTALKSYIRMVERSPRLLAFLSMLTLAALGVGALFVLGGGAPAESMLRIAVAKESQPEVEQPAAASAEPALLTLASGDIPLLQSLTERSAKLEEKEKQLSTREEELQQLQQRIEEQLSTLSTLREQIASLVAEREAFEEQRFEHLVKVYEGMKAGEAASLIERLNEDTAVKLFYRMKEKKVSRILAFVNPDLAAKLSERLAVHQRDLPPGASKENQ